jgi:hypothetical protein
MRDLTKYEMTERLIKTIRRSPSSLTALGFAVGLTQADLSNFIHGRRPFGAKRRERVLALAANLGVPADRATRRVVRRDAA